MVDDTREKSALSAASDATAGERPVASVPAGTEDTAPAHLVELAERLDAAISAVRRRRTH